MTDIFREVDDDLRRDKALKFWEKYQNYIIGLMLLIVAGAIAFQGYSYWRRQKAEAFGAQYEAALQLSRDGKNAEAQAALAKLAGDAPSGYRELARLKAAADAGQRSAAEGAQAYDAVANDGSVEPNYRNVARLRAAMLLLDTATPEELARRLDPLAAPAQPMRHSARELIALAALKSGDTARAARFLDLIVVDTASPPSLRQRAEILLGLVRSSVTPPAATAPAAPSTTVPSTTAPSTTAPATPAPAPAAQ